MPEKEIDYSAYAIKTIPQKPGSVFEDKGDIVTSCPKKEDKGPVFTHGLAGCKDCDSRINAPYEEGRVHCNLAGQQTAENKLTEARKTLERIKQNKPEGE